MSKSLSNKREKTLLIITSCVIISSLIFTKIIEPQLERYRTNKLNENSLKLTLTKMHHNVLLKDRIDNTYMTIEPYLLQSESETKDAFDFAGDLRAIYEPLGITPKKSEFKPSIKEEYYKKILMQIEMEGNTHNLMRFIEAIESLELPIKIEKMELTAKETAKTLKATLWISKIIIS